MLLCHNVLCRLITELVCLSVLQELQAVDDDSEFGVKRKRHSSKKLVIVSDEETDIEPTSTVIDVDSAGRQSTGCTTVAVSYRCVSSDLQTDVTC